LGIERVRKRDRERKGGVRKREKEKDKSGVTERKKNRGGSAAIKNRFVAIFFRSKSLR